MEPLRVFRNRFYACLGRRADALFELCDAILTAGKVPSPLHLSLVSVHRRGWGSLYAALRKGGASETFQTVSRNCLNKGMRGFWSLHFVGPRQQIPDCGTPSPL